MQTSTAKGLGPKSLFYVLKGAVAEASLHKDTRDKFQRSEFGSELSITVLDDVTISVPGSIVGGEDGKEFLFTLKPEGMVDNRAETEDVLLCDYGSSLYQITEGPAASQPDAYELKRLAGNGTNSPMTLTSFDPTKDLK